MIQNEELASIRRAYIEKELTRSNIKANPLEQFQQWLLEAIESKITEPNAMVLSTVSKSNEPSSRVVLLKAIHEDRLQFFTNYLSDKAADLSDNPTASLLFYWRELGRQVRISGSVTRTSSEESERYFNSRPYESRIAALISKQSRPVGGRSLLQKQFEEAKQQFPDYVPMPEWWGGYNLLPVKMEFWQGRENRLHDRILYELKNKKWNISRLYP